MLQLHELTFADADTVLTGTRAAHLHGPLDDAVIDLLQGGPCFNIGRVTHHHHMQITVPGVAENKANGLFFIQLLLGINDRALKLVLKTVKDLRKRLLTKENIL